MSPLTDDNAVLQHLQTIWDGPEGVIIIDAFSRIVLDVNPAAARLFGASKEQMVGHICHKFICPTQVHGCPIMDMGQTVDRSERKFVRADGQTVSILKSVTRISYHGRPALLEQFTDLSQNT